MELSVEMSESFAQLTRHVVTERTLFIFHAGRPYRQLEQWALRRKHTFLGSAIVKFALVLEYRRGARSLDYMGRLARRAFADFDPGRILVVDGDRPLPVLDWGAIDDVVLLWPDANGTGWTSIVRHLLREKRPSMGVFALNGRGRVLVLNRAEWRRLTWRRFLEQTLALELGCMLLFLVVTPWLAFWDFLHGRR